MKFSKSVSKVIFFTTTLVVTQFVISACGSTSMPMREVSKHQKALKEFDAMASSVSIGTSCAIQFKGESLSVAGDQEKTYNLVNNSTSPATVIPFSLPVKESLGSFKAERGGTPQYWRADWVDVQSNTALQTIRPAELRWSVDETVQKTTEFTLKTSSSAPVSLADCN